ncbi:hypothetical protein BLOT_015298, partial [Blomia tropicalis]
INDILWKLRTNVDARTSNGTKSSDDLTISSKYTTKQQQHGNWMANGHCPHQHNVKSNGIPIHLGPLKNQVDTLKH